MLYHIHITLKMNRKILMALLPSLFFFFFVLVDIRALSMNKIWKNRPGSNYYFRIYLRCGFFHLIYFQLSFASKKKDTCRSKNEYLLWDGNIKSNDHPPTATPPSPIKEERKCRIFGSLKTKEINSYFIGYFMIMP